MKDLRVPPDPHLLAALREGGTVDAPSSQDAVRRARLRHRVTAGLITCAALAVVIWPHLIDSTRISSIASEAARDAGGASPGQLSCPAVERLPAAAILPQQIALTGAVICGYPAGSGSSAAVTRLVPPSQLSLLNADLQAHTRIAGPRLQASPVTPAALRTELWAVVGVTVDGERVSLASDDYPVRYMWTGSPTERVWRPSASVRQMLAADLAS